MGKGEQVIEGFWDLLNKKIRLDRSRMKDSLKGYKPSEVHCIEYIGRNEDPNVTKLAESFYMTNGAISKLTKKLMEKGVIESYRKPDNRKEIYFRLTEKGDAVHKIHEDLHNGFVERDKAVFEQIPQEQLDDMIRFTQLYSRHLDEEIRKLGVDMKSEGYDRL